MAKYKKITYFWIIVMIVFILFHIIIYFKYIKKSYDSNYIIGDLSRMSYAVDLIDKRKNKIDLVRQHMDFSKYTGKKIDFITIGDSFSQGGGGGLNPYYQDYISTVYNIDVLNLPMLKNTENYIETISLLSNSGELEKIGVKYILIESVQRSVIERFRNKIDFTKNDSLEYTNKIEKNKKDFKNIEIPVFVKKEEILETNKIDNNFNLMEIFQNSGNVKIISNLNYNAFIYNLKYILGGYGKITPAVYREKINKDLFSTNNSNNLLFYHEDISSLKQEIDENINKVNNNLNILAKQLAEKKIKLIFMPAVDKYNLYRDYITSNEYKNSVFFETLEKLPKDYIFINTKKILKDELNLGEKDIYYVDDTHWSYKASEAIIKNESFKRIFQ